MLRFVIINGILTFCLIGSCFIMLLLAVILVSDLFSPPMVWWTLYKKTGGKGHRGGELGSCFSSSHM